MAYIATNTGLQLAESSRVFEADAVILIDVDGSTFNSKNVLIFYVGTSRARLKLDVITKLSDEDCVDILKNNLEYTAKIKKPKKELASALNAIGSAENPQ